MRYVFLDEEPVGPSLRHIVEEFKSRHLVRRSVDFQ
jgi:hypothetical protein